MKINECVLRDATDVGYFCGVLYCNRFINITSTLQNCVLFFSCSITFTFKVIDQYPLASFKTQTAGAELVVWGWFTVAQH